MAKPTQQGESPKHSSSISGGDDGSRHIQNDETLAGPPTGAALTNSSPALAAGQRLGRYEIVRVLGVGGMGAVYLADDTELQRKVALKVPKFPDGENRELIERFYREARSAATLHHPTICPVYDIGEVGGLRFITMAYIDGKSLADFCKPEHLPGQRATAKTIRKLALGLAEAHDQGIVHRDLKPSNIMINRKGEPVVMDFGLARWGEHSEASQLTHSGTILGTPAYMPPEQVNGEVAKLGPPADIYSLGVVMYQLLTGQVPFQGEIVAILMQIITKQPTPPSTHRDVDPHLEQICLRMLAKEIERRPASMRDVAAELTSFLKTPSASTAGAAAESTKRIDTNPTLPHSQMSATASTGLPTGYDTLPPQEMHATPAPTAPLHAPPSPPVTIVSSEPTLVSPATPSPAIASIDTGVTPKRGDRTLRRAPTAKRPFYLAGASLAILVVLATVFLFRTKDGVIRVEIHDPAVEVAAKSSGLVIRGADSEGKTITVSPGQGEKLTITRGGLQLETDHVQVKRGGEVVISISYEAGKLSVTKDGKPFGSKSDVIAMGAPKQPQPKQPQPTTDTRPAPTPPAHATDGNSTRPASGADAAKPFPPNGDKPTPVDDPSNPYAGQYALEPILTLPWVNPGHRAMRLSPNGRYLAYAPQPQELEVRDLLANKVLISRKDLGGEIMGLDFNISSSQLAVGTKAPDTSQWALRSGEQIRVDPVSYEGEAAIMVARMMDHFVSASSRYIRFPAGDKPGKVFAQANGWPLGLLWVEGLTHGRLFSATPNQLSVYIDREPVSVLSGIQELDALDYVSGRWLVVSYRDSDFQPHLAVSTVDNDREPGAGAPTLRQIDLGNLNPLGGFAVPETGHFISPHARGFAVHDLETGKYVDQVDGQPEFRGKVQKASGANIVVADQGEEIVVYRLAYRKKVIDSNQHRRAAEWVQKHGCRVGIETPKGIRYLGASEELPAGDFVVSGVDFSLTQKRQAIWKLPYLPNLKELTFGEADPFVCGPVVGRFTQLESLKFTHHHPAAILIHMTQMSNVKTLNAYRTNLTDDDLKSVTEIFPQLTNINLVDSHVTPKGLHALLDLHDLAHLRIQEEKVTPELEKQLKAKLPNLSIRYD